MKTIGLIGGMSWESSAQYYRIINETMRTRLGGLHSAKSLMYTVDFAEIERLQHQGLWDEAGRCLGDAAQSLERGGADFVLLCTNTMHKVAGAAQASISIPFLHIADATAARVVAQQIKTVGLLGTAFTMEQDFYKGRLQDKFGLAVLVPNAEDRQLVHRIIYDELCLGKVLPESKQSYKRIINDLTQSGADGIILGCTEIMLLIGAEDCPVPIFDTTRIHAEAAVDLALDKSTVGLSVNKQQSL